MTSPDGFELRAPIEPDAHMTSLMGGDPVLAFPTATLDAGAIAAEEARKASPHRFPTTL